MLSKKVNRIYAIESLLPEAAKKDNFFIENFSENLAFKFKGSGLNKEKKAILLEQMKNQYKNYREGWRGKPAQFIAKNSNLKKIEAIDYPPMSVDIELASICDLACPFCYRQHIATPDKLMDPNLAKDLIRQCGELGVPSIKFNWRGEPLLHSRIPDFIRLAKESGILEVIINTNATNLTMKMSEKLIDAGLDLMIYSFDGGTKETYESMRPGRFKENSFESVYQNIKNFKKVRDTKSAVFPYTKIQMILTEQTFKEQEQFFINFGEYVDDISVKAYSERGGKLSTLNEMDKIKVTETMRSRNMDLNDNVDYMKNSSGELFIATGRIACEQVFQRLMVSYDGRVFMCCYDWGNEHPVGVVSDTYNRKGDEDYFDVIHSIKDNKKGFELMAPVMPDRIIATDKKLEGVKEIWEGRRLNAVRTAHLNGKINKIKICKKCDFKETFKWLKVDA